MQLVIDARGVVHTLYDEALDLRSLGLAVITRASHVEPDAEGLWWAEIIGGPRLGPFERRSLALAAEVEWLEAQGLRPPSPSSMNPFLLPGVLLTSLLCLASCSGSRELDGVSGTSEQPLSDPAAPAATGTAVSGKFTGITTGYSSTRGSSTPPQP